MKITQSSMPPHTTRPEFMGWSWRRKQVATVPCRSADEAARLKAVAGVTELLKALIQKHGFPGAEILVSTPQFRVQGRQGFSHLYNKTPLEADSLVYLGSTHKLFTAVIIMQLMEEGRLKLEDPIREFIPATDTQHVANTYHATVLNLLQHTAGIPDYYNDDFLRCVLSAPMQRRNAKNLLAFCEDTPPLCVSPNNTAHYSNTHYLLLGMIIEKVTGKPLAQVYKERIFDRVGMPDTSLGPTKTGKKLINGYGDPFRHGYMYDITQYPAQFDQLGDDGIVSTVSDLERFTRALFEGNTLLQPDTVQKLVTYTVPYMDAKRYGLGIMVNQSKSWGPCYSHDGTLMGYQSVLKYFPNSKTVIAVVGNRGNTPEPKAYLNGITSSHLNKILT